MKNFKMTIYFLFIFLFFNCLGLKTKYMNKNETKLFIKNKIYQNLNKIKDSEFKNHFSNFFSKKIDESPLSDDYFFGKDAFLKKLSIETLTKDLVQFTKNKKYLKYTTNQDLKSFINKLNYGLLKKEYKIRNKARLISDNYKKLGLKKKSFKKPIIREWIFETF